jgi:hypothetical protein
MDNKVGPLAAIVLSVLLLGSSVLFRNNKPVSDESLKGTLLLCIHEKQTPSIDEVIAVRGAREFTEQHGFAGWLVIDQDDPNWKSVVQAAASRQIDPPLLAAGVVTNGKLTSLVKVTKWQKGLEDILK